MDHQQLLLEDAYSVRKSPVFHEVGGVYSLKFDIHGVPLSDLDARKINLKIDLGRSLLEVLIPKSNHGVELIVTSCI